MTTEFEVTITKSSRSIRVGITFESDEDAARSGRQPRPWVKALHPYGLAATGGLQLGDEVLSINGNRVTTPLAAASMLREGEGIIRLSVRRQAAASGSSSGAGPSEAKHGVSGLPRLGLSHAIPQ